MWVLRCSASCYLAVAPGGGWQFEVVDVRCRESHERKAFNRLKTG